MFDCHMHTRFSTDSIMDASEACETALGLGLDGVAFTDHQDYDYPGEDFSIDFNEYIETITAVRDKYEGRIKVLRAVEVGIQPHVVKESFELVNSFPFDYVLASIHVIDRIDPYKRLYYSGKTKAEAYGLYLNEIFKMTRSFGSFDMVGHFEYIIRCADYDDRSLRYADHSDILDMIMRELITQGRGFELNTGTFRAPASDADYDIEMLKQYRRLGGELVCLGSDAHRAEHIASKFDYYTQMLRDAGFRYTVHFENRKPVFDKL